MSEYITIKRAELERVLAAMERVAAELDSPYTSETEEERQLRAAITALRTTLAQQALPVEPALYGFMSDDGTRVDVCFTPNAPRSDGTYATAYYTTAPRRKPLTDEEIEACRQQGYDHDGLHSPFSFREAARAVERKVRGEEK